MLNRSFYRNLKTEISTAEDRTRQEVKTAAKEIKAEMTRELAAMEARNNEFMLEKLGEVVQVIRQEALHQDSRLGSLVERTVKREMAMGYFTKEVRRSTSSLDEVNGAKVAKKTRDEFGRRARDEMKAEYKEEERRFLEKIRKDEENLKKVKEMGKMLRREEKAGTRLKISPRAKALREAKVAKKREEEVARLEEELATPKAVVVELDKDEAAELEDERQDVEEIILE